MKLLLLTDGDYSDYRIVAVFDWLGSGTPPEAYELYLNLHPEQKEDWRFDEYQFAAWLVREGYAKDVECEEFHLSSYISKSSYQPLTRREE